MDTNKMKNYVKIHARKTFKIRMWFTLKSLVFYVTEGVDAMAV